MKNLTIKMLIIPLILANSLAALAKQPLSQDQSHDFHGKCPKAFLVCTNEDTTIFPYNNYAMWYAIWGKNEHGVYEDLLAAKSGKTYTHIIKPSLDAYGPELASIEKQIQYVKAPLTFPCWWHYKNGGGDCQFIDTQKKNQKSNVIKKAKNYCRVHYGMKHGALIGAGACHANW